MSTQKCYTLTLYYRMPDGDINKAIMAAFETELGAAQFMKNLNANFSIEKYTAEELEAELTGFKEFRNDK